MTPRQLRRLQQKLERKAQKREQRGQNQIAPITEATAAAAETADVNIALPSITETDAALAVATVTASTETAAARNETTNPTPSISEKKLLANRANAQLSTGPRSAAGRAKVSQNRTRHGLTGDFQIMPNESAADFQEFVDKLIEDENPADAAETELVHQIAEAMWLSRRAVGLQDSCIRVLQTGTEQEKREARQHLALYMRYQTTHERSYSRYAAELRRRKSERRKIDRGFESQKAREAARQATEKRKLERHEFALFTAKTKLEAKMQRKAPAKVANPVAEPTQTEPQPALQLAQAA